MKKNTLLLLVVLFVVPTLSAQTEYIITEDFSSGLPADWASSGVTATSYSGIPCVSMGTDGYLITPTIGKAGSLTFSHRASGNGKTLLVEKSVDGGEWITIGSCSPSSASSFGSSSMSVNDGSDNIRIRFTASSSTIYLTDIKLTSLPDPVLSASVEEIDLGTTFAGEKSVIRSFNVTGTYLSSFIAVDCTGEGFAASTDGLTFSTSVTIGKDVTMPATVYVQYSSPATAAGSVSGHLTISTIGAESLQVALSAYSSEPVPTFSIEPLSLNFGYVQYGSVSNVKEIRLNARYLEPASGTVTVDAPEGFQVSTQAGTGFTQQVEVNYTDAGIAEKYLYLRFAPEGDVHLKNFNGDLEFNGGGADAAISLKGIAVTSMEGIAMQYYISPAGNDISGDGSLNKPWYSLSKAVLVAEAGDTIHCRGGVYNYDQTIELATSGEAGKRICIFAYQDDYGVYEEPVFDFANQEYGASNRALLITGNYWYIFGIHITHAGDNGIKLEGNYCIVERCIFSYNGDTGIQLGFGHDFSDTHPGISENDGSYCAYNLVVDCDSYQNYDPDSYGGDADGFACKMHNGLQNWFMRCRAWNNSDDAWDLYETDFPVYIIECWGFHSGDASQHPVEGGSFQGNGNGIKMGGNGTGGSSKGKHEAWNCVAFNNNKTSSVKGFDQNSHKGGVKLVNCLGYNNGYDYMFEDAPSGATNDFYNNVCLSNRIEINPTGANMQNNVAINNPEEGWLNALDLSFSSGDYGDLSEDAAKQNREEDGSLPGGFARLLEISELVDKGLNQYVVPLPAFVDQPLIGTAMDLRQEILGGARDLGPYESPYGNPSDTGSSDTTSISLEIYTNNIYAYFSYNGLNIVFPEGLDFSGTATLLLFNLSGQAVLEEEISIEAKEIISIQTDNLNSGAYIYFLKSRNRILGRGKVLSF